METMKAVRFHTYGGPEVLVYEDAPKPEPAAGEVLVKVHATSVNPVDCKGRAGHLRILSEYPLPFISGSDVSGVVESTGAGVTKWKSGDEVYGRADLWCPGAYAEYITMREGEIAYKPKKLDHIHSAAIPLAGLTAWQALFDSADLKPGQKVLIQAAAGGVGHLAIQLAKLKELYVAGTASGRNQEFLKQLGCDQPINYETTRFEDVVHDFDAVIESIGGEVRDRSWKVLKKGGILVALIGPQPSQDDAKQYGVRATIIWVQPKPDQLAEIANLADAGRVRPEIAAVFPLREAAKAQQMSETEHVRGKIVLQVV
ncbi:MAG: putative NADPH:quinone reductase (alcohol dehydrogenase superfamily) [Bryobacterales bacterium]|nr:putative NADPH:quinone reductase (alcohol dehydrogenase superfamily) [Bryobacterales bacterium]